MVVTNNTLTDDLIGKEWNLVYVCFGVKPFQEMILHLTVYLVAHGK